MLHSLKNRLYAMRTMGGAVKLGFMALGVVALVGALVGGRAFTQSTQSTQPVATPIAVSPALTPGMATAVQPQLLTGLELSVRGYLAVAIGRSGDAEKNGLYSRLIDPKDIQLPGVDVYLEDPQTGKTSETVKTDLSGRFTLYAPDKGRYRLCWKSRVYDSGCTDAFISTGKPQFLSNVRIPIARKQGFAALTGRVNQADGSLPRTFEPYLNINSFAMVGLQDDKGRRLADVYVNNFGDYLIPYAPAAQSIKLVASVEGATFTQEIWPEARVGASQVHRINLKLENHKPQLQPLTATDALGQRVQNAAVGSEVIVKAVARDKDGDTLQYAWAVDNGEGEISQNNGDNVRWKMPSGTGRHTITVVAYDGKGGYDRATLSVLADGKGVPFTGVVVDPSGAPVKQTTIDVVGNPPVLTDNNGRFAMRVKEAQRYVFNARKDGYALNSRVYDRGVSGGRWLLRPAQTITIDPTQDTTVVHKRSQRDCPGPDSASASLGAAGESLTIPQWQDGQGNVVDAPVWRRGQRRSANPDAAYREAQTVVIARKLKLPRCGPGVSVQFKANTIVDAAGNPVTTPVKVTVSTVDVLSPQQMPGDESVVPAGGGGGYIESFGAGSLDLPAGMKLKPGSTARVVIPVDRSRLVGGAALPATVPYLSYDEKTGLWVEEGVMTLATVGGVKSYVGQAKHFSPFNADNVKNATSSCVRVFSQGLPGKYDLEVSAPLGGTGAPKVLTKEIDQTATGTEHVIYNLPNNTNITLVPMTQAPNKQVLGFYVVNTGAAQSPNNSPNVPPGAPYTSCQNFVVLKVGSAPDAPFGGEFLHGLGFISATNLGFANDLDTAAPSGNALRDAVIAASKNYYTQVSAGTTRDTFADFKTAYGFNQDPTLPPVPGEIVASYANSGDLGFGRDMHCIKKASGDIGCYVTNYGSGYNNAFPGGGTDDQDDANAAGNRGNPPVGSSLEVATVAMEYAQVNGAGPRVVKFYVFKKNLVVGGQPYARSISANLDGRGERPVPQLCMICHGGLVPNQSNTVPVFNSAASVNLGSRFIPFDHRLFTFPNNKVALEKGNQEAAMKSLNKDIVDLVPAGAPATDPIREVVKALYDDGTPAGSTAQLANSPPAGWKTGQSSNAPGQLNFYNKVVANACRTCHTSQPFAQLQFNTSRKFLHLDIVQSGVSTDNGLMLGTAQNRVCGDYTMAHALRTHEIFWQTYSSYIDPAIAGIAMKTEFNNFGAGIPGVTTWKNNLCTSFIAGTVTSPSEFFTQTLQPLWNGKCVACHIAGGIGPFSLTEGNAYGALVAGGLVVPGNDSTGTLLSRITAVAPGAGRMPPKCFRAPEVPGSSAQIGNLPCLTQGDIDKIKAWIRTGAN